MLLSLIRLVHVETDLLLTFSTSSGILPRRRGICGENSDPHPRTILFSITPINVGAGSDAGAVVSASPLPSILARFEPCLSFAYLCFDQCFLYFSLIENTSSMHLFVYSSI